MAVAALAPIGIKSDRWLSALIGRATWSVDPAAITAAQAIEQAGAGPLFLYARIAADETKTLNNFEDAGFRVVDLTVTLEVRAAPLQSLHAAHHSLGKSRRRGGGVRNRVHFACISPAAPRSTRGEGRCRSIPGRVGRQFLSWQTWRCHGRRRTSRPGRGILAASRSERRYHDYNRSDRGQLRGSQTRSGHEMYPLRGHAFQILRADPGRYSGRQYWFASILCAARL